MFSSPLSEKVFLDRYSLKDKNGKPLETKPQQMWRRVAKAVAANEVEDKRAYWEDQFYNAMQDFKFIPGGRILSGAGTGYKVTFYNCFVIPSPKDSREGILQSLNEMVEIMARGGGVGINLSSLRPRGTRVEKVNGFSSGPINWAELFSLTTKDIIQQGGSRRGALMLMLWDWHPDIEEFITVKQDPTKINGANLSVCVSDAFMEAVDKDDDWDLIFPDKSDPDYDTVWDGDIRAWEQAGKKIIKHKTVKARKLWDMIIEGAWRSAEPGVVFLDRYNKLYNNYYWNKIIATNPCAEEGLPPWGVCNLGSLNLSAFVKGDTPDTPGKLDYEELKQTVHVATRFLDNVVDIDPYIFEQIKKTQLEGERRIGLGTLGLGDALIKMHLRYGSPESLKVIDQIYSLICNEAYSTSAELAKEKGSFPKFDATKFVAGGFVKTLPKAIRDKIRKEGIRNSLLLMQAPTGSTSLMAGTTSGIEPVFEFEFIRRDRLGEHVIRHHLYEKWYKLHGRELEAGKCKRPDWFVSANDLTPEDHVRVQAVIQKYVDASISKTVNAPKDHTIAQVKQLYEMAYKEGLKGIAYFRDGCRDAVLTRKENPKEEDKPKLIIKPRPMVVHGSTYKINTPVGNAFITINTNDDGEPFEIFINVGKVGTDLYAMATGLGRAIALAFQFSSHLPLEERVKEVVQQLEGIGGTRHTGFGKEKITSLPDAVAKALAMHFKVNGYSKNITKEAQLTSSVTQETLLPNQETKKISKGFFDICPSCGDTTLAHEEGCKKCYACGYSEC